MGLLAYRPNPLAANAVPGFLALSLFALGCAEEPLPNEVPLLDRAVFEQTVYPLVLRDCGFPDCHAASGRFYRVFGPNRTRLNPATGRSVPPTPEEIDAAYERSRAMVYKGNSLCAASLLVRKPLSTDAGGAAHEGLGMGQRDIYLSQQDPGYVTLVSWACQQQEEAQ